MGGAKKPGAAEGQDFASRVDNPAGLDLLLPPPGPACSGVLTTSVNPRHVTLEFEGDGRQSSSCERLVGHELETALSEDPHPPAKEHMLVLAYRKCSYVWSTAVLVFSLAIVYYGIGAEWNNPPWDQGSTHPVFESCLFSILLFWVCILEGAQVSIVGLQSVPIESFRLTHPQSYRCCKLVHAGPNVERFIVGRQFLLLFIVFIISRIGGAGVLPEENFYIGDWRWNSEATQFFWVNSVLLLIVIIVPILVAQLLAADKMLAFLELSFAPYYTVVLPSLALEAVGITHAAYVLKELFVWLSGVEVDENDPKRMHKNKWYYVRCFFSVSLVIFSGVFVFKGLFAGQTGATNGVGWDKLPGWAAFLLTLFFLFVIGCCEGFQIAAVSLAKLPSSDFKTKAPIAYQTTQILFAGRNMQAFLVGRQVFVAMMMVLLAKVTGYAGRDGELVEGDDWGMGSDFNEILLQTGILGAVFVVNVGQLSFRMAASSFPVLFINNFVLRALLRVALVVEATGIVNACWPLTWGIDRLLQLKPDPVSGELATVSPQARKGPSLDKGVAEDVHHFSGWEYVGHTYKVSYI